MYRYVPDEVDRVRAHQQAVNQGAEDEASKRVGNLGELAFEQFCREFLPVEMWEWRNEDAIRECNPESFAGYDFEVFGYEVDVKTSRDVSAFLPGSLLETDPDDDVVVMAWHRDKEDSLILLGWERMETLHSKVAAQADFSGDVPEKLDHLPARPMNELLDLGPNTAHMNQKPENPFGPGDRVVEADADDPDVAVVVTALPPEKEVGVYGQTMDDEAVAVAYPSSLDDGEGDWRNLHPGRLASYCDDEGVKRYTYAQRNLAFADNPFVAGDRVVPSGDDANVAVVVARTGAGEDGTVDVVYPRQLGDEYVPPGRLAAYCREQDVTRYTYSCSDLELANRD